MSLPLLLDENFRDGALWHAIQQHNAKSPLEAIDVMRVGDPDAPPLSTKDPLILHWAVEHGRIVITKDFKTLIHHQEELLASGLVTPGIAIVPKNYKIPELVASLTLISAYGEPEDFRCQVHWMP